MPYSGEPGVNHLAYEVDDVESLRARRLSSSADDQLPQALPRISSTSPSSGVVGAASPITITGTGFEHGSVVTLTASPAAGSGFPSFSGFPVWLVADTPQLSVDVNYLAQFADKRFSLPPLSGSRLPNPEDWAGAASAYAQLARDWPKDPSQLNAAKLDRLIQINAGLAEAFGDGASDHSAQRF
jgi:hypothetical protein